MLQRSVLIAIVAGISFAFATTAAARNADLDACSLISTGQIGSIFGLQHVQILKNILGTSAHDNTAGVTHSVCNGVAWSGTPPTTSAGVQQKLASGTGAAFAIDTWAPDNASANVEKWKTKGFDQLTGNATKAAVLFPALPAFRPYHIHRLLPVGGKVGVDGAVGGTATLQVMTGIRAGGGVWWAYPSSAAVSIAFEGSARKPTVEQLNRLAKIAVGAFGLNPLQLR
jgi:hypothetical protein